MIFRVRVNQEGHLGYLFYDERIDRIQGVKALVGDFFVQISPTTKIDFIRGQNGATPNSATHWNVWRDSIGQNSLSQNRHIVFLYPGEEYWGDL